MLSSGELLFVFFYWLLFTALILKVSWFKKFGVSASWIAGLFLLKVLFGIAYGLIHFQVYKGGDTFGYFADSKIVMSALPHYPLHYLQLVFGINHRPPDVAIADYAYKMSYTTDMSSYFMVRMHSLMNLLTFCHYYGNVVIYNFLTLLGELLLFKFFVTHQPEKKIAFLLLLFLFPSVSFWCSGFHKDGIAVAAIGLILFHSAFLLSRFIKKKSEGKWVETHHTSEIINGSEKRENSFAGKLYSLLLLIAGTGLLIVVRNYLFLLLVPCIIAYYFISYSFGKQILKYFAVIILFYVSVFQLQLLNPGWDLLNEMASKQQEFLASGAGKTNIDLPVLQTEVSSLMQLVPTALFNCLFLPSVFNLSSPLQLSSALDNLMMLLLLIAAILAARREVKNMLPVLLLCIFFSLSVYIFTGSIVPNIGALVRYKMPGTLFLAIGLLMVIDVQKIKRWLQLK